MNDTNKSNYEPTKETHIRAINDMLANMDAQSIKRVYDYVYRKSFRHAKGAQADGKKDTKKAFPSKLWRVKERRKLIHSCLCPHYEVFKQKNQEEWGIKMENYVNEYRLAIGFTYEELAEKAGCSKQTIKQIETEKYIPSLLLAVRIAAALYKPLDVVFSLELAQTDERLFESAICLPRRPKASSNRNQRTIV